MIYLINFFLRLEALALVFVSHMETPLHNLNHSQFPTVLLADYLACLSSLSSKLNFASLCCGNYRICILLPIISSLCFLLCLLNIQVKYSSSFGPCRGDFFIAALLIWITALHLIFKWLINLLSFITQSVKINCEGNMFPTDPIFVLTLLDF